LKKGFGLNKKWADQSNTSLKPSQYLNLTTDCKHFTNYRGYITSSLTLEEKHFPIAYSIVTFKDFEMFERLLRAVYRPQNYYCVHVDRKSGPEFFEAVSSIADCFDNVFLSRRISVEWGTFTVLEPDLICMEALFKYKRWKYFINLTGQEFPLKTNEELVKILTAYNGANNLEGTIKRANKNRFHGVSPPHGIRAVKGSVHIVVNREFVDFVLHNQTAADLLSWARTVHIPDEAFFSTINYNPQLGVRGSYTGVPETTETKNKTNPFMVRYKNWGSPPFKWPCAGYKSKGICIISTGDLPLLKSRPELFANKFHINRDRLVVGCLEEALFNRTRDQFDPLVENAIDTEFYKGLGFVKNQVFKPDNSN